MGDRRMNRTADITVVVDLDEVTCDLSSKWFGLYNADWGDTLTPADVLTYDTHLYVHPDCGTKIYGYLESPGFFRDLLPMPGAQETLRWASKNFRLVIATSRAAHAHEDTVAWIEEFLPFVDSDNVVFTRRKELIDGDVLIDDAPQHILAFRGVPIVFGDYGYNQGLRDHYRAADWAEVRRFLQQILVP